MSPSTDSTSRLLPDYAYDPLRWVAGSYPWGEGELAGQVPLAWQRDILETIGSELRSGASSRGPVQIAVASGHGIGKSALVAWITQWALATCVDARVVVTANTGDQLGTKTWPELGKWVRRSISRDLYDYQATSLRVKAPGHESTWRADAQTWSIQRTEAFAGLHNQGRRIVLIFDEASAIDDKIWDVAEGALTDRDTDIIWLAFGNPTQTTGRFRACFGSRRHRWITRQIDSRDVPITNKRQLGQWVDDYGEDSDFVRVRVRGQFPRASVCQLIGGDIVEAATRIEAIHHPHDSLVFGVDVARFGDDETVIAVRYGRDARTYAWRSYRGLDTTQVAARVIEYAAEFAARGTPVDQIFVDDVGVGGGVTDQIRGLGWPVIPVVSGASAPTDIHANLRAYMWLQMRDWLKDGGAIPPDQRLIDDLTAPQYGYSPSGKIILEKKADMKSRGLASPDYADALAMTFARPIPPKINKSLIDNTPRHAIDSYDPYASI